MVASLLGIAAVIAAIGLTGAAVAAVLRLMTVRSGAEADLQGRLTALELKVENLPSLWEIAVQRAEESLAQAKREHGRARAARSAAQRARDEQDESDADPDLFERNGEASGAEGVPPMRRPVAVPPPPPGAPSRWPPGLSPFELEGLM
jgi:hypothetical protein